MRDLSLSSLNGFAPRAAWSIASNRCCTSTKQATGAREMKTKTAKMISSMIISPRDRCRAHAFQSRVSGSSTHLTRVLLVLRVVKVESRCFVGANRPAVGVNGMIVAGIEAFQIVVLNSSASSRQNRTNRFH